MPKLIYDFIKLTYTISNSGQKRWGNAEWIEHNQPSRIASLVDEDEKVMHNVHTLSTTLIQELKLNGTLFLSGQKVRKQSLHP